MNKQFEMDTGKVDETFNNLIAKDKDNENRPRYTNNLNERQGAEFERFKNIEEASRFWKEPWEKDGIGNRNANWLEGMRTAINSQVPAPPDENVELDSRKAVGVLKRKKNWNAPGPDKLTNNWWKQAIALHDGVTRAFKTIMLNNNDFPLWFTGGRKTLIPKPGSFSSDKQRPITCLNTIYKWFTSCLLEPMNLHLDTYKLMEIEQRGPKVGCSGTMNNLLIDRMTVTEDCHRGKRKLSMAWVDVAKAYDSIDHEWLDEMMILHRFPTWLKNVTSKLSASWNTRIQCKTDKGAETSDVIRFKSGLPLGDALCPRLFTLCMNPVAWILKATEGYKLSRPIDLKITDLLYIDYLKIFAASQTKLATVMTSTQTAMKRMELRWNSKKCSVLHVRRGVQQEDNDSIKRMNESFVIQSLKQHSHYKFLGVLETHI